MFGEPELFAVGGISDAAFCCHFRSSLFVFAASVLVCSVASRESWWEAGLRNGLFCVEWDVKP